VVCKPKKFNNEKGRGGYELHLSVNVMNYLTDFP